jgi:hypothetical protein
MNVIAQRIDGRWATYNAEIGLLSVYHDGNISWDDMQHIKNKVLGPETRAIEVYPAQSNLVNAAMVRHMWKLEDGDKCPDLLGPPSGGSGPSLYDKLTLAWREAEEVFKEKT